MRGLKGLAATAVVLACLSACVAGAYAQATPDALDSQDLQRLGWMEEALSQPKEGGVSSGDRIARLEILVFGVARPEEPMPARLQALHEALLQRKAALKPQPAPEGREATANPQTDAGFRAGSDTSANASSDAPMDAPMVDILEQKALGRAYPADGLSSRLSRLETRVFGKPRAGGVDSDRVDALRVAIMGPNWPPEQPDVITEEEPPARPSAREVLSGAPSYAPPSSTQALPPDAFTSGGYSGTLVDALSPDEDARLSAAEMQVFRRTFVNEAPDARVARLEMRLFQRLAPTGTPLLDRLDRVAAVATANNGNDPLTSGGVSAPMSRGATIRSLWPIIPMILLMFL